MKMSRELKFRGWIKDEKKMRNIERLWFPMQPFPMSSIILDQSRMFGADEVEIMEFTGLKDKNEKEIYEGDIVKGYIPEMANEPERKGFVKWGSYGWVIDFKLPKYESGIGIVGFCSFHNYEAIGNIYENPELLGVDRDEKSM